LREGPRGCYTGIPVVEAVRAAEARRLLRVGMVGGKGMGMHFALVDNWYRNIWEA